MRGPMSDRALDGIAHDSEDWKLKFIRSWRLWPERTAREKAAHMAYIVADTRIPDHTLWHHNALAAALKRQGHQVTLVPLFTPLRTDADGASIPDVFTETQRGSVDFGVVPVENSTEGPVVPTLDTFVDSDLKVCSEIVLPISLALYLYAAAGVVVVSFVMVAVFAGDRVGTRAIRYPRADSPTAPFGSSRVVTATPNTTATTTNPAHAASARHGLRTLQSASAIGVGMKFCT